MPEAPKALADRRVEITGPVERKMMINALNSGAKVFMADFEDANSPTWDNVITGQVNLQDAVRGTIELVTPEKTYRLADETADPGGAAPGLAPAREALHDRRRAGLGQPVRLRAVRLPQRPGEPAPRGFGPYFYLPKLESHLEARLWNDVMFAAEDALGLDRGSIRATVLIETITAAFEMDEILYELRDHICGLNAGRWDYIFSVAKRFHADPAFVLPDRSPGDHDRRRSCGPTPSCWSRPATAAAPTPSAAWPPSSPTAASPRSPKRPWPRSTEDKRREAGDGFDGTWVAHPDLVATAQAEFDAVLGDRPNQLDRQRPEVHVGRGRLLDVTRPARRDHPGRARHQHLGRPALPGLLAVRHRRGRHRRPHGRRRHRRDQPGPGVAVGPPRVTLADGTAGDRRAGPRACSTRRSARWSAGRGGDPDRPGPGPRRLRAGRPGRRLPDLPDPSRLRAVSLTTARSPHVARSLPD